MAIITTGQTFTATDTVTNTKLQDIADAATFNDPVDETTLELITGGTNAGKLGIKNAGVTFAKLADVIDDDTMGTATNTTLATSESIKAYVDEYAMKYSGVTGTGLQVSGTSTYRDLDLSSVVGANRALVIMEIEGSDTGADIFFRTKGSTVKPVGSATNPGWGASGGYVNGTNDGFTCVVTTNENGVLEYTGGTASGINYKIQAYQKLA